MCKKRDQVSVLAFVKTPTGILVLAGLFVMFVLPKLMEMIGWSFSQFLDFFARETFSTFKINLPSFANGQIQRKWKSSKKN